MASDQKLNLDQAIARRFYSSIQFFLPDANQRLQLWKNIFNGQIKPAPSVDFQLLAEKYELSRTSIINVFRIEFWVNADFVAVMARLFRVLLAPY